MYYSKKTITKLLINHVFLLVSNSLEILAMVYLIDWKGIRSKSIDLDKKLIEKSTNKYL